MALQVWLPMTKDLSNQGVGDVTVTNNGAVLNSAGKLGGCYDFTGNVYVSGTYKATNAISFACWIYFNTAPSGQHVVDARRKSDGAGYQPMYFTGSSIQLGSTASGYPSYNYTWEAQKWYHIVCIHDQNGNRCYVNGELLGSAGSYKGSDYGDCEFYLATRYNQSNYANVKLNDFRIYDHGLSPREVAEIAKGLVAHYPLGDSYLEGTTNLAPSDGYGITATCYNGATSKYGYGTTTDMYRDIGDYEGRHCTRVHMGTSGLSAYPYVYFNNQTNVGETKTLSFDYFPSANSGRNKVSFYNISTNVSITYEVNGVKGTANNYTGWLDVKLGQWNHIVIIGENVGSANGGLGYMQIGPKSHTSSTDYYWLFSNVQVELKDHATGYTPPGTTRAEGEVYDTSGYVRNGTANGTFTISSDTPRYSASTQFSGTQYIQLPFPCSMTSEAMTVSCWGYKSDWNTTTAECLIGAATSSSGWCIGDYGSENTLFALYADGGYNTAYGFKQLSAGWHHFAITFDGLKLIYYLDGAQFNSKTFSTKKTVSGTYNIQVGCHYGGSYKFNGKMSDIRIYATALTADQVKQLYEAPISLANNGTLFANEFNET